MHQCFFTLDRAVIMSGNRVGAYFRYPRAHLGEVPQKLNTPKLPGNQVTTPPLKSEKRWILFLGQKLFFHMMHMQSQRFLSAGT